MILYPPPQRLRRLPGSLPLVSPPACHLAHVPSKRFVKALATLGVALADSHCRASLSLRLLNAAADVRPSGYTLTLSASETSLAAPDEAGLYRGLQRYLQIASQCGESLNCLIVEDWPDLSVRGYMLDVSRCKVPTMDSLRQLVDLLASLGYNQLQLYTEHTFAYREHETVWRDASPMQPDEIRSLDAYCSERYIELVPNQNSFGHMERWLRHPEYRHLAESPDGYEHPLAGWKSHGGTLKPNHASLDFMDRLYAELLPHFSSSSFNIGGDEPWELGQGWSKHLVSEKGKRRVYLDFLLGLCRQVSRRGRRIQFWGDIIIEEPALARELPEDVTALLWGYEAEHPFPRQCAAFAAAGRPFMVVPGTSTWNTIGGRLHNALPNIEAACAEAIRNGAMGILLTDWGDNGHHHSPFASLMPILRAAGAAWNFRGSATLDFAAAASTAQNLRLSELQMAAIRQLSEAGRFAAPIANATWLNKILFADAAALPSIAQNVARDELERSRELLDSINLPGNELLDQEIELAKDLLLSASRKGLAALRGQAQPEPKADEILDRFEECWLARNRPGGLDESRRLLAAGLGTGR